MTNKCLNCHNDTQNNFCSVCGQKASTHRYSLQHFFVHDMIHGVFHFDKGFFYTLRELFTKPGHSIREFIEGKRTKHFNYFSFALIILVINHYLSGFSSMKTNDLYENIDNVSGYEKVADYFFKVLPFLIIPFLALVSQLIFKRSKQNYTEHLIINVYRISATKIIMILFNIISIIYGNKEILYILFRTIFLIEIIYSSWFFYQYFSVFNYKKANLIFKSIITSTLVVFINNGLMRLIMIEVGKNFF
jgi:hypothetical protein